MGTGLCPPAPLRAPPLPGDVLGSDQGRVWWEMRQQGLGLLPSEKAAGEFQLCFTSAHGKISADLRFSFLVFLVSLFLSSLVFYGVRSFPRRGNLPGGRSEQWEPGALAEIAAEAISLAQQLLLEKSLFTGNVLRKKPNTYIPSASARHSPGRVKLPKAPYLGRASTERLGFRKSSWERGSTGLLLGTGEGRGEMKIPAVVCPASLNSTALSLPSGSGCPNFTRTVTSLGAARAHP